jgi:hypothetical protein
LRSKDNTGYHLDRAPETHFARRVEFLAEAGLSGRQARRYRRLAKWTYRRESAQSLNLVAGARESSWMSITTTLLQLIASDPLMLAAPATWRLMAAQLGGRQAKRFIRNLRAVLRRESGS